MKDLPVISVKEARKLLGTEARSMDDEQIMLIILLLTEAADEYLKKIYVNKSNNSLG